MYEGPDPYESRCMDGLWQALLAGPAAVVWASLCHVFPKFQLQSLVSANVRLPVLAIKPAGPRLHSFAISAFVCARLVHRRLRAGHHLFVGGDTVFQPLFSPARTGFGPFCFYLRAPLALGPGGGEGVGQVIG